MEIHESDGELHRLQRNVQARSSSTERDICGANDRTIELPDEILCHILSFLSLREAARTSIVSRKWRSLWRHSVNLNFDVHNMAQTYARRTMIFVTHPYLRTGRARVFPDVKLGFVTWVNQVLNLHANAKIVSFRVNFPLFEDYNDNVIQWIGQAAAKEVERLEIILADSGGLLPYQREFYEFPYSIFAQAHGRCFLKYLCLDSCTFNPPRDFSGFRNLTSLSLMRLSITQGNLDSIFSCTMLESFSMSFCFAPSKLKIAGSPAYLNLKHLQMFLCHNLEEVEISDAPNLSSFEYAGFTLRHLLFRNCAKPSKLGFLPDSNNEAANTNAFRQLSFFSPELGRLLFRNFRMENFESPEQLPKFGKLKELVLVLEHVEILLKMSKAFLIASPLLHRLEVHLPSENDSDMQSNVDIGDLFQHKCLKEVKMVNFHGGPEQLQLAIYLLKSAVALERMTVVRNGQIYKGNFEWQEWNTEPEVTKEQVLELFMGKLPASLKFTVL